MTDPHRTTECYMNKTEAFLLLIVAVYNAAKQNSCYFIVYNKLLLKHPFILYSVCIEFIINLNVLSPVAIENER